MRRMIRNKTTKIRFGAVLLVCVLCAMWMAVPGKISVNAFPKELFSDGESRYYTDYNSKNEARDASNALGRQIVAEGSILLKNEGNFLPLSTAPLPGTTEAYKPKVTLLGNAAAFYVAAGGGSGAMAAERINNPLNISDNWFDAFVWDGYYDVNLAVRTFYESTASGPNAGASPSNLNLATSEPTAEMIAGYNGDNDVGIVFFSRQGTEVTSTSTNENELSRVSDNGRQRHWLALHDGEIRLLTWANANFENVIVVVNSANILEMGFLNDTATYPNIKAAFHVGCPGSQGVYGFPQLLRDNGVNPSGHAADNFSRDFTLEPTWQNFGGGGNNNPVGGVMSYYVNGTSQGNYSTLEYEEGIYMGYRYWETRGYTEYLASGATEAARNWNWYNEHMNYPFGYGLSYTTFDWEIINQTNLLTRNGNVFAQVKVTNTGRYAGKDVVQMYYTAPYTAGGIEKSHVTLGEFEKTKLIQPGEYDIVTVKMPVRDLASWDWDDFNSNGTRGAYEMDPGIYKLNIARNAHDAAILAAAETKPALRVDLTLSGQNAWIFNTDDTTGTDLHNLFEETHQYIKGTAHANGDIYGIGSQMTVMSRANFAGTFPTPRLSTQNVNADFIAALGATTATGLNTTLNATILNDTTANLSSITDTATRIRTEKYRDLGKPYYKTEMPTLGTVTAPGGRLTAADLIGLDYDDPLWDHYMNQWTNTDFATALAQNSGGYQLKAVSTQGLPNALTPDGPAGFNTNATYSGATYNGLSNRSIRANAGYPSAPIIAQTYNKELAYSLGRSIGNEALWGNGTAQTDIYSGWYAPGMNTHRSQFAGRNFEYYSEDGKLAGLIGSQVVLGLREKGVSANLKHFALNDQEAGRQIVSTWADEQTMREIYFKPFELCVKIGKTNGIMASMNRVGTNWATNDYRLLTQLLRDEWGFRGNVVSDYGVGTANFMPRAGCDYNIAVSAPNTTTSNALWTPTHVWALRTAAKNLAYTTVNSNKMQQVGYSSTINAANISNQLIRSGNTEGGEKEISNRQVVYKDIMPLPVAELNKAYIATVGGAYASEMVGSYGGYFNTREFYDENGYHFKDVKYSITAGELPTGLTFNESNGVIEGTPIQDGTFNLTVSATAGTGNQFEVSSQQVSLIVEDDSNTFTYNFEPLDDGIITDLYSASVRPLRANGTPYGGTIEYKIAAGSSLPNGLTLEDDGTITGRPTAVGTYTFSITATRSGGGFDDYSATAQFTLVIGALPIMNYGSATATNGRVGQPYSAAYDASTTNATFVRTYEVSDGELPAGLSLNAATGVVSGTPTEASTYEFEITASAENGNDTALVPVSKTFTVIIYNENASLQIPMFGVTPSATVGVSYAGYQVAVLGNNGVDVSKTTIAYSISSGRLPFGMTLNEATGQITGTPAQAGVFLFEVSASAVGLDTVTGMGAIMVTSGSITFSTASSLGGATINTAYIAELSATTAVGSEVTYALKEDSSLPAGLQLNAIIENGIVVGAEISGSATTAGTYTFTIVASAGNHISAERTFTIVVSEPVTTAPGGCGSAISTGIASFALALVGIAVVLVVRKTKKAEK